MGCIVVAAARHQARPGERSRSARPANRQARQRLDHGRTTVGGGRTNPKPAASGLAFMIADTFRRRVQGVVATLLAVERFHGQDTGADGGGPGVARWAGRPVAWPVVFCRPGAAEARGSRPAAGRRRRRCAAALRPEGRPRMLRGARWVVSGGASRLVPGEPDLGYRLHLRRRSQSRTERDARPRLGGFATSPIAPSAIIAAGRPCG